MMPDGFDDWFDRLHASDRQRQQYLLLYMQGLSRSMTLAIDDDDVEVFRERLLRPVGERALDAPFYWLSTFGNKEILISLADIEYVNFLFEIERPLTALMRDSARQSRIRAKDDQREGTVDLYLRGRPRPVTVRVTDSVALKQIFETLSGVEAEVTPSFAAFTAADGSLIAFRPDRLILLVAHRGSIQLLTEADYEALFQED